MHDELLPLINLAVNTVWRLHAHLLGFSVAYATTKEQTEGDQLLTTLIDTIVEKSGNPPISLTGFAEVNHELDKKGNSAREAAECLLYGRIDALQLRLKYNGEVKCDSVSKKGIEMINDMTAAKPVEGSNIQSDRDGTVSTKVGENAHMDDHAGSQNGHIDTSLSVDDISGGKVGGGGGGGNLHSEISDNGTIRGQHDAAERAAHLDIGSL
jgi:hypothetical protein